MFCKLIKIFTIKMSSSIVSTSNGQTVRMFFLVFQMDLFYSIYKWKCISSLKFVFQSTLWTCLKCIHITNYHATIQKRLSREELPSLSCFVSFKNFPGAETFHIIWGPLAPPVSGWRCSSEHVLVRFVRLMLTLTEIVLRKSMHTPLCNCANVISGN